MKKNPYLESLRPGYYYEKKIQEEKVKEQIGTTLEIRGQKKITINIGLTVSFNEELHQFILENQTVTISPEDSPGDSQ